MASKMEQGLVSLVKAALSSHNAEWEHRRNDLKLFRDLYASRFFGDTKGDPTSIRVETGDGPAHIESYLASLFSRSPAVEVGKDKARAEGDPRIPASVCNGWLGKQRETFEQTTRIGLIYPCAFLRVGPDSNGGIEVRAVCPWDVILDTSAPTWAHQRWIGHRYTLPLAAARARFSNVAANAWMPQAEKRFFETPGTSKRKSADEDIPQDLQLVTVIEFYDLVRNKVIFYSPDKDNGDSPLKVADTPLRLPGTTAPSHPIVPVYFGYEPDAPVVGISTLSRIYDQLRERNLLRTNAANCIRKDTRQYLARKGAFSEDDAARITLGQDGAIVWVDENEKKPLADLIAAVPVAAMSSNYQFYSRDIENDLNKGSVLAAFTRGEATRATATEIGVLAEYSASAIGRMARVRDAAIEAVAALYLAHLLLAGGEEGLVATADIDGKTVAVTRDQLDYAWTITALDQAATPISKAIEQQRFLALVPILQSIGVRPDRILAQLVRLELLPIEFGVDALAPPAGPQAPAPAPQGPQAEPTVDELLRLATTGRSVADAAPGNALPAPEVV